MNLAYIWGIFTKTKIFQLDLYLDGIQSSHFQLFGDMQQKRLKYIQSKQKGRVGVNTN